MKTKIEDKCELITPNGENLDDALSRARLTAAAPALLEALKGVTRILEAFSYTTKLGKTQQARLTAAKDIITQAEGK